MYNNSKSKHKSDHIVMLFDRPGEQNHFDSTTAITINLPSPFLSQQHLWDVEFLYFILHIVVFYVYPKESVKYKFYLSDKSIPALFT